MAKWDEEGKRKQIFEEKNSEYKEKVKPNFYFGQI